MEVKKTIIKYYYYYVRLVKRYFINNNKIETRLQDTIIKIIKYRSLVNKLASRLVTFESSP